MYKIVTTKQFRKDVRALKRSNKNIQKLMQVITLLQSDATLPASMLDHALKGNFKNQRECHISPDWLLRYQKEKDSLLLVLISTGDHRHVLGIE